MIEIICPKCGTSLFDKDVKVWKPGRIKKAKKIRCPKCFTTTELKC